MFVPVFPTVHLVMFWFDRSPVLHTKNVPFMVTLARVTAETTKQVPRVAHVVATVANMCCGMVQRQVYE